MAERVEKRRAAVMMLSTETVDGTTIMDSVRKECERSGQDLIMLEEITIYPIARLLEHGPRETVTFNTDELTAWMPYATLVRMADMLPNDFPQPEFSKDEGPGAIWGDESTGNCVAAVIGPDTDQIAVIYVLNGKVVKETIYKTINGASLHSRRLHSIAHRGVQGYLELPCHSVLL